MARTKNTDQTEATEAPEATEPQSAKLRGATAGPIVTVKDAPEAGRKMTFTAQNGVTYGGVVLAVEKVKGGHDVAFTANGIRPE